MKRNSAIAIAGVVVLHVLAIAVLRGRPPRELILKRDGLPLARLDVEMLPNVGAAKVLRTATDGDGRLDLRELPDGTEMIAVTLRDGSACVFNGDILLPVRGSRTLDFRGHRSICTTETTYADFWLFKLTTREVQETVRHNENVAPAQPRPE